MLDFIRINTAPGKRGIDIYPEFITKKSKDLMVKGHSFYAVWDEGQQRWLTDEYDIQRLIDAALTEYSNEKFKGVDGVNIKLLSNYSTGKWREWQNYCKSLPDNYHNLDNVIVFKNNKVERSFYATHILDYPIESGDISAYDELVGTLYDPEERQKIEWAIGAIVSGDSKKLQKFIVLYGPPGSGKSTILNIIDDMFKGYTCTFDAKDLGSSSASFSLEAFRNNPLIGLQTEGDLSKIEDNTKLNALVAHEQMLVNEKFKSKYEQKFITFLFMCTNKPVKITDAKSGILRRLIDVSPSGNTVPEKRYNQLMKQIKFEYGAIADHCLKVYEELGPIYYSKYVPINMLYNTNSFYNFMSDEYPFFSNEPEVDINVAWRRYKQYVEDARIPYPYSKMIFKQEIMNYFDEIKDNILLIGFKKNKFKNIYKGTEEEDTGWIELKEQFSIFDETFANCKAQLANEDDIPTKKWQYVKTELKDIDTRQTHFVLVPEDVCLITIDFDLKDKNGKKSLKRNLNKANEWPKTYCELSKSGVGVHLEYYYKGDPTELNPQYDKDIEIKISKGNASLRRRLTLCNDIPIATLSSGLPKKEKKKMITTEQINDERHLRNLIIKNLKKEIHEHTKPSMDMILMLTDNAYHSGMHYDIRDMKSDIIQFANNSHNNALYCLSLIDKMHFCSDAEVEEKVVVGGDDGPMVFYDIECLPNLFVICWAKYDPETLNMSPQEIVKHYQGKVIKMINPKPDDVMKLLSFKLVGFNNRRYDNHMIFARTMGYNNEQLFKLSQNIINDGILKYGFNEAYNLSYTDVYDFMSASNKMGLKKWEIKLGIDHVELPYRWDEPVPEDCWDRVADYCCNDVVATIATFNNKSVQSDWKAREILADIAGLSVNHSTNQLTTKIIVGDDPNPQSKFVYTDLSTIFPGYEYESRGIDKERYEGNKIVTGKSIYRNEDPGEGGYVYACPGIYFNVDLMDIASMHPTSAHELNIFGDEYTQTFWDIVTARLLIKHKEFDEAKKMFGGKLAKYLDDPDMAKALANALKTAINSVYGLTSSTFPNKLRDPRNVDNIVAKRGALFMINLKHEVENMGYKVVHIKTDSIKIANGDQKIRDFVTEYGKKYGYNFEYEARYTKMCLVNESTYIALEEMADGKPIEPFWTATGAQFQIPYVFKKLFSHEDIVFDDLCETKAVSTCMYLDMNEGLGEEEHDYHFVGKVGRFTPIIDGRGGGILLREGDNGKMSAVTGTKKPYKVEKGECHVYKWMESEMVKTLNKVDCIDYSYFDHLVHEAFNDISKFGDGDAFIDKNNTLDPNFMNVPEGTDEELPFE